MSDENKTIACVAYPGMSLLELTGLYSTLIGIQQKKHYRLHVVGAQAGPIDTDTPLQVVADKSFDDLPHPSMLFITGSGPALPTALNDEALLNYLRSASHSAELIGSI
ncbi:MAG: DJ-1/PfpI family protein, partial [Chloroflexi bacterium]|nr:DJ-1/PfpI family protein [Chloroflexota bacterium]